MYNLLNKNIGWWKTIATKISPKGGKLYLEGWGANASIMHDKGRRMELSICTEWGANASIMHDKMGAGFGI
jgi:hypothetical protein